MRLRRGTLRCRRERSIALAHDEAYRDAPPGYVALVVQIGQAGFGTIGEFDVTYNCMT